MTDFRVGDVVRDADGIWHGPETQMRVLSDVSPDGCLKLSDGSWWHHTNITLVRRAEPEQNTRCKCGLSDPDQYLGGLDCVYPDSKPAAPESLTAYQERMKRKGMDRGGLPPETMHAITETVSRVNAAPAKHAERAAWTRVLRVLRSGGLAKVGPL